MLPLLVATVNRPCPRPGARRGDARSRMSESRICRMRDRTLAPGQGNLPTAYSLWYEHNGRGLPLRPGPGAGARSPGRPVGAVRLDHRSAPGHRRRSGGLGTAWRLAPVREASRWLAATAGSTGRLVATDLDTRFLDDL